MKLLIDEYTFNAAEGTIHFPAWPFTLVDLKLNAFLLITNVTDRVTVYQFNDPDLGASIDIDKYTLILDYDTSAMSDSDDLQIFVDVLPSMILRTPDGDLVGGIQRPLPVEMYDLHGTFESMVRQLKKINTHLEDITGLHLRNFEVDGE